MLGVTTYMTTDIAAIPLFWVMPLALYLLTFILVFVRWPVVWTGVPHSVMLYVQPVLRPAAGVHDGRRASACRSWLDIARCTCWRSSSTALVCHGELAKDRPARGTSPSSTCGCRSAACSAAVQRPGRPAALPAA